MIKPQLTMALVFTLAAWSSHSVADIKIAYSSANLGSTTVTRILAIERIESV